MPLGGITGFIIGASLAYFFILPNDILHTLRTVPLPLISLTDIVRILAALSVTVVTTLLGRFLDR
jgi:hypothetical protein